MEFLRLAEGLVLIVAAISLKCSEPLTIEVPTSEIFGFDKPFRWKCMQNDTLNIVLKKNYEDNINWNLAMEIENECQLKFASMQLRKYNGDCIDSITFAYSDNIDTLCRRKTITTREGKQNISITVSTGTCRWWQGCWWNPNKGGFSLTLLGVSRSRTVEEPTNTPEKAETSATIINSTEADDEDLWRTSSQWQFPNCTDKELDSDTTHNSTHTVSNVVIDCKGDSKQLINSSDMTNQSSMECIEKVGRKIISRESQCIEWCNLIVPNITDPPIFYLNETHAYTVDLKSKGLYLISCEPADGGWATTPSCEGFKHRPERYAPPAESQNLAGIVSGVAIGVFAATIILVAIVLIVRRKSQRSTKRAKVDGSVEHGDGPIEMEDNPVYG